MDEIELKELQEMIRDKIDKAERYIAELEELTKPIDPENAI